MKRLPVAYFGAGICLIVGMLLASPALSTGSIVCFAQNKGAVFSIRFATGGEDDLMFEDASLELDKTSGRQAKTGFGKTDLMYQWLHKSEFRVRFIKTLRPGDQTSVIDALFIADYKPAANEWQGHAEITITDTDNGTPFVLKIPGTCAS